VKALDIMTRDVATIPSSATVAEAMSLMQERGWRSLIVDRDNEEDAYGIITETDVTYKVAIAGKDPQQIHVCEIMTKPCIVVNPDLSAENIVRLFVNNRLLRAPVIRGELLGIISISDILVKSHLGEKLHEKFVDQNLQQLVQHARTAYAEAGADSENSTTAWNALEETLAELSQQHAERVLKAALEEYFEEFEEFREPQTLDNLCSG
jgi:CBS domain-containing protein